MIRSCLAQPMKKETNMDRYQTPMPRIALGIAAVAMTTITFGVSVVMPAKSLPDSHEPRALAAVTVTAPATKSTADVIAGREPVSPQPRAPRHG